MSTNQKTGLIFSLRGLLVILTGVVFSGISVAQNLASDPSFELGAWQQANNGSADWVTNPNVFGNQVPHSGIRYMGESFGRSSGADFRENIKNQLTAPMVIGQTYEVSMYVSLCENYGQWASNHQGFAFTTFNPYWAITNGPLPITAQYKHPTPITDKVNWTQVAGTFVATQAYTWVTIGNFDTQMSNTWVWVGPASGHLYGYYYMDDMCIGVPGTCGLVLPVELLSFEAKASGFDVAINWTTGAELNSDYFVVERSTTGEGFEGIATIDAAGSSNLTLDYSYVDTEPVYGENNYYKLRQVDVDGKTKYSKIVLIQPEGALNTFINVYPVPATDKVTIEFNADGVAGTLQVFNAFGIPVLEKISEDFTRLELTSLPAGYYFAVLNAGSHQLTRKFIVSGCE